MIEFNKKLIFKKFFLDNAYFFLSSLATLSIIVWVIQAVNYLDYVTEDGHGLTVYFQYTFLNLPKIVSRLIPFIFFVSIFYTLNKFEDNNELKIFWINGINKKRFVKNFLNYSIIYLLILLFLSSFLVPWSQNKGRVFIQNSNIDFFPSLINEKRFIDTVDKLTIYVEKKIDRESYKNIFLKDSENDESKIIFAESGKLINNENERFLKLFNGKIITVNEDKVTSFDFQNTTFDLSKYLTKTITDFKIQEKSSTLLLNCYINFYLLKDKSYYDVYNCNDEAVNEIQQELFKRMIKPFYLLVLTISVCFLMLYPKENNKYKFFRVSIFILGILVIVFSEISSSLSARSFIHFQFSLFLPLIIFLIQYLILTKKLIYNR